MKTVHNLLFSLESFPKTIDSSVRIECSKLIVIRKHYPIDIECIKYSPYCRAIFPIQSMLDYQLVCRNSQGLHIFHQSFARFVLMQYDHLVNWMPPHPVNWIFNSTHTTNKQTREKKPNKQTDEYQFLYIRDSQSGLRILLIINRVSYWASADYI